MLVKIAMLIVYVLACSWSSIISFYIALYTVPSNWQMEATVIMALGGWAFLTYQYLGLDKSLKI